MDATDAHLPDQLRAALGSAYRLERELIGGGMSRVFVAEDTQLRRRVVVKVLHPDLAADVSVARFAREVEVAARLQHPHVVPLFTAGAIGRLLYYTMPYVDGHSLRERLVREGALPVRDVVRLMRELASALGYAHGQGIVHRDLKPENVLLSGGHATIVDFGIAKALSAATAATTSVTAANTVLGTPLYMAPEQAAADPATDHRADLYALGLIGYELLSGVHPFAGRGPQAVLAAHFVETPPSLKAHRPDVPQEIDALVSRLLAKQPQDRPQSAAEVIRLLDDLPTDSRESRPAGAARSRIRRWQRVAGIVGLTLVGLAAATALVARRSTSEQPPLLVVLPFENLGPASDEYFADGLTDEVTTRLARVSGLRVIGRASARRYKATTKGPREIARELGATHLLTGTVRWDRVGSAPGRVRVVPELVRAADEATVWAEPYETPLSEVFGVQTAVAERVAAALDVALLAHERRAVAARPTGNLAAYDAYLRGLANSARRAARFSVPAQQAAIAEFARAVTLDPTFGAAHARLAEAHLAIHHMTGDSTLLAAARASSERALALDATLVESRLAHARYVEAAGDPDSAYAIVSALAREVPDNADVLFRLAEAEEARGRPERGIPAAKRAAELDPRSADAPAQLAGLYIGAHRYAESIPIRDRELALAPDNTSAYFVQASAYLLWRADTAAARRVVERGGPVLEAYFIRLPSGSAGRAIWRHVLSPSALRAKDTLTLAGYLAAGGFPPELFHLMKLRHFAHGGHEGRARSHADSLAAQLESMLRESGDARLVTGFFSRRAALAEAYAYLGRIADASREIDRSVAEARRVRSPTALPYALVNAAYVDVMTGRHDLAVVRLKEALQLPSGLMISRALLGADPSWTPLRDHRGFQMLIAEE